MKSLFKLVLLAFALMPFSTFGQFTTTKIPANSTIKSGVNVSPKPNLTLGKTTLDQVNSQLLDNSWSNLPKISLNPADLERNRIKSWEITPSRPITPGMDLNFMGNISKTSFYVVPILTDKIQQRKIYQALNLSLITSMLPGKDYRLTIEFENPNELPDGGGILISLGGTNHYLQPEKGKKEAYFVFHNSQSAPQILSMGPLVINEDFQNPKSYGITKLKLEELAPAQ